MGRQQTPKEHKCGMVEMILSGSTLEEAAAKFGYSLSTVKNKWRIWAREYGYTPTSKRQYSKDIPDAVRREIADQMARGEAGSRLCVRYGVTETIIYSRWREWAEEFGIQAPPKRQRISHRESEKRIPEEKKRRRAVLLKNQGWTDKQASEATGLPARKIALQWRMWAKELGIHIVRPVEKEPEPRNGPVVTYFVGKGKADADQD